MFLDFMDVKYSNSYSDAYYNEHPYKTTLYGLSQMCSHYGIENVVLEVDKSELIKIDTPFITSLNNDFALIFCISESVSYYSDGKIMHVSIDEFIEKNSGIVLVAEKKEFSIELDYKKTQSNRCVFQIKILFVVFVYFVFYVLGNTE